MTPQQIKSAFGLSKLPFAKESLTVFKYAKFNKAFESLYYLAQRSGIGSLTAPPGCGKSVLLGTFIDNLSRTSYYPVYVTHTTCSIIDLYRQILHGFGIEPTNRKAELYRRLHERLTNLASQKRVRPVLIID